MNNERILLFSNNKKRRERESEKEEKKAQIIGSNDKVIKTCFAACFLTEIKSFSLFFQAAAAAVEEGIKKQQAIQFK